MSWKKVRLGDVGKVQGGYAFASTDYKEKGIPLLRISNINNDIVDINDKTVFVEREFLVTKPDFVVNRNDILIAMSGATTGKFGIYDSDQPALLNQRVGRIQLNINIIDRKYFYFFLFQIQKSILGSAYGAAIPNISPNDIASFQISLPPLETQKHIASILDKADELRQQNRALLAHYDALLQSTFIEMFGDPVSNPKGWEVRKLGEVVQKIESGWSPVCLDYPREFDDQWAVLKLGAISARVFKSNQNKLLPADVEGQTRLEVRDGDLLFSRKNTRELVGATAYVFNTPGKLMIPDTVFRLVYKKEVSPFYLLYLLNDVDFRKVVQNLSSGSSGSMPNISKEKLMNMEILVPPFLLQKHFAKIVEAVDQNRQQAQASMADSEALFQGLLAGYFGER